MLYFIYTKGNQRLKEPILGGTNSLLQAKLVLHNEQLCYITGNSPSIKHINCAGLQLCNKLTISGIQIAPLVSNTSTAYLQLADAIRWTQS